MTVSPLVADAINQINQLTQYSIQNNAGRPSNEFARSYKAAMQLLASALQAVGTAALQDLANVGGGAEVFRNKVGQTANLRSIVAGANVTVTQLADTISIAAAGGGGAFSINVVDASALGPGLLALSTAQLGGFNLVRVENIANPSNITAITLPADDGSLVPGMYVTFAIVRDAAGSVPTPFISAPGGNLPMPGETEYTGVGTDMIFTIVYAGNDEWLLAGGLGSINVP